MAVQFTKLQFRYSWRYILILIRYQFIVNSVAENRKFVIRALKCQPRHFKSRFSKFNTLIQLQLNLTNDRNKKKQQQQTKQKPLPVLQLTLDIDSRVWWSLKWRRISCAFAIIKQRGHLLSVLHYICFQRRRERRSECRAPPLTRRRRRKTLLTGYSYYNTIV